MLTKHYWARRLFDKPYQELTSLQQFFCDRESLRDLEDLVANLLTRAREISDKTNA